MRTRSPIALFAAGIGTIVASFPALSQTEHKVPIVLESMGSFHVGGKIVEITGQPTREVVFTPARTANTWSARCTCNISSRRKSAAAIHC